MSLFVRNLDMLQAIVIAGLLPFPILHRLVFPAVVREYAECVGFEDGVAAFAALGAGDALANDLASAVEAVTKLLELLRHLLGCPNFGVGERSDNECNLALWAALFGCHACKPVGCNGDLAAAVFLEVSGVVLIGHRNVNDECVAGVDLLVNVKRVLAAPGGNELVLLVAKALVGPFADCDADVGNVEEDEVSDITVKAHLLREVDTGTKLPAYLHDLRCLWGYVAVEGGEAVDRVPAAVYGGVLVPPGALGVVEGLAFAYAEGIVAGAESGVGVDPLPLGVTVR